LYLKLVSWTVTAE